MSESSRYLVCIGGADPKATRAAIERLRATGLVVALHRSAHGVIAPATTLRALVSELSGGILIVEYAQDHGLSIAFHIAHQHVATMSVEWECGTRAEFPSEPIVQAGLLGPVQVPRSALDRSGPHPRQSTRAV